MAKTLADMTAGEREECVGMWCETGDGLEILAEPDGMVDYHDTAVVHSAKRNGGRYVLAKAITPRFDLPRAWTPDGEPELAQALAEETWEYSVQIKDHTGEWETATNSESHLEEWWESKKHAEWAMTEEQEFGEHCRIVRRRVSPPEVINE